MEQLREAIQNIEKKITVDTILFFDLDGTLIHTNHANFLSYKKAIQSVTKSNYDLTYDPNKRFNRSNLKNVVPNLSDSEYEKIIQEKEGYYKDLLPETKLNSVIVEILFKYTKTNKTVLVTNCRKARALTTLNYFELTDKFSTIICSEFEDKNKKINKYQNAISLLGVSASSIVVFENEQAEIEDAMNAGVLNKNILSL